MKRMLHFPETALSTRIARFALLSLAAHLALLATWEHPALLSGQHDSILSVSLSDATEVPAPAQIATVSSRMHRAPALPSDFFAQANADIGVRPTETESESPAPASESAARADGVGVSQEPARIRILARLRTDLARYFDYPALARSRGWEGTVLLGLRVESNGHLEKIRIEHSSGYAVLDNSALNSLNRLGRLAEASAWLNGRGLDMQLPVIYRLIEN